MSETLLNCLLLSLILVSIYVLINSIFLLLLISKKQREALKILNLKSIGIQISILLILTFPVVYIFTVKKTNALDISGIVLSILVVSIIPTYNYIIEPIVNYVLSKKNNDVSHKYKSVPSIGSKIRIIETEIEIINAYATGILPYSKTIILGKGIHEHLNEEELHSIIFHEIGHLKMNHLLKLYVINLTINAIGIIAFTFIAPILKEFQLTPLLVGLYWSVVAIVLLLFSALFQRKFEKQADLYSAKMTSGKALINALVRIDTLTKGKVSKKSLNYPTLNNRILNVKRNS